MNQTPDLYIISLLQKYIENKCSEKELRLLLNWLKSSDETKNFDRISNDLWLQLNQKIAYPDEMQKTKLNKEVDQLFRKIKKQSVSEPFFLQKKWLPKVAAILLFILGIGSTYLLMKNDPEFIEYTEIYASQGEIKEYTFDDGTHVILNSESKLLIPSNYNNSERTIEMTGEGFFNVTANPQKPFVIKSGKTEVKVLGTSFNFKSYEEDNFIEVTVSTGKVLVNISEMDVRLKVTPSEHLSVNKHNGSLSKSTLQENNYTKWRDGALYFEQEPILEVLKTINRKYDTNVILDCPDCHHIITGTHDNKNIDAVIDAICFTTGLKKRSEGQNIILYK